MDFVIKSVFRLFVAVVIGIFIGIERGRHGRAAGMRTHVVVCLGAALTSLIGIYVSHVLGFGGDVLRICAQVISGIGFLGAGMIILKNNNVVTGLTTAAGVWTTGIIGIAVGFGFYSGAVVATVFLFVTNVLFSKLERHKRAKEIIYMETDDMYKTNEILKTVEETLGVQFSHEIGAPKSLCPGHLGISIILKKRISFDVERLLKIENVVFVDEE